MKPAVLPIICGAALAVMAGAASTHYLSVRQMVILAENSALPMGEVAPAGTEASETEALIAQIRQENASLQGTLAHQKANLVGNANPAPAAQPPSHLNQVLAELVALNRDLRNQVAETNRDLMELQFRVDTHSEQFRPLNLTEDYRDESDEFDPAAIGVLPPLDPLDMP